MFVLVECQVKQPVASASLSKKSLYSLVGLFEKLETTENLNLLNLLILLSLVILFGLCVLHCRLNFQSRKFNLQIGFNLWILSPNLDGKSILFQSVGQELISVTLSTQMGALLSMERLQQGVESLEIPLEI